MPGLSDGDQSDCGAQGRAWPARHTRGATGAAGVNIEGMCAFTGEGRGVIHPLIADDAVARAAGALEHAGMGIADQREALVVDVTDDMDSAKAALA